MKVVGWFCYYAARSVTWILGRFWWSLSIKGREHIPKTGPFILAPVHRSNIDGPLAAVVTRRRMRYLAKESMFKIATLAAVYRAMGAIQINRGTPDRQSLHLCLDALGAGYPLVLFPEGGRRSGPVVEAIEEGATYLALRSGAPIVPVGIGGTENANPKGTNRLRRVKVHMVVGEPMTFTIPEGKRTASRSTVRETTEQLRDQLQMLYDRAQVAVGASVSQRPRPA